MLLNKFADLAWPSLIGELREVKNLFVLGRSVGYAIACEAALKLKETCALHAEAYSLAEVKHGPMEIVGSAFPVLIFDPDPTLETGLTSVLEKWTPRRTGFLGQYRGEFYSRLSGQVS